MRVVRRLPLDSANAVFCCASITPDMRDQSVKDAMSREVLRPLEVIGSVWFPRRSVGAVREPWPVRAS
jgi:hypothetical protein